MPRAPAMAFNLMLRGSRGTRQRLSRAGQTCRGLDPDVFVNMGFAAPGTDQRDDRRFRSHLSMIVSRMVNKFITLPVLKDHRSAGVTLSLKNMSHGMNKHVARSHISGIRREALQAGDGSAYAAAFTVESGPNQCNTFIPTAVNQHRMRQKATLHILDGLIGVYEGGPGSWTKPGRLGGENRSSSRPIPWRWTLSVGKSWMPSERQKVGRLSRTWACSTTPTLGKSGRRSPALASQPRWRRRRPKPFPKIA